MNELRILRFPERRAPRRLTVSTENLADYSSIQDAINDANAGDTIVLDAGMYLESLVIDKPVHLVGPNDPRFADEEMAASEEAPCAMIIGVDGDAIVWAANGGSIRDIAVSLAGKDDGEATSLIRMTSGKLQVRRCVLSDGAYCGISCEGGQLDVSRTHIRHVEVGVCVLTGEARLERVHVEGPEVVAVNVEPNGEISLVDNCFEGRTMLRGAIQAFAGNDMDTLFMHDTFATAGNRISSLVHLCEFRSVGEVAVGV
jgi:hypothetical protein